MVFSRAANDLVQPQPQPGTCHAIGSGLLSRPDPACTPGALNPAVRQSTIGQTICVPGWTASARPPESVTEREKVASLTAYGDSGSLAGYEYDHFVPLELGGATNDARNLWPEPGGSPNPKDGVEFTLREKVCAGAISLAKAQREIVTNWVRLRPAQTAAAPAGRQAECSASAAYSRRYHDYDVYVHSNQPDQTVTVTDAAGHSDSWHTDSRGYADVYFRPRGAAPGRRITARVGAASCSTSLPGR